MDYLWWWDGGLEYKNDTVQLSPGLLVWIIHPIESVSKAGENSSGARTTPGSPQTVVIAAR